MVELRNFQSSQTFSSKPHIIKPDVSKSTRKRRKQVLCGCSKVHEDRKAFLPTRKHGNMDETPAFFDTVLSKCITAKGTKKRVVRTSGDEKNILQLFCQQQGMEKCSHQ